MVELVYKFDEKSYRESIAKVRFKKKFFVDKHTYNTVHMDTSPDHITPCSHMRMQGKKVNQQLKCHSIFGVTYVHTYTINIWTPIPVT